MSHQTAPLVVAHRDPEALRSWLSPFTQDRVEVVGSSMEALAGRPGSSVVALPYDGPLEALAVVVRAILAERSDPDVVVAPVPLGGSPPSLDALAVVAAGGLRPAADLLEVAWVSPTSLWWTDPAGPRALPLAVTAAPAACREVALLLAATRGFDPTTTVGRWLEALAGSMVGRGPIDWSTVLAAHLVETAVGRLARRTSDRTGTLVTADVLQAARAGRRVVAARRPWG